MNENVVEIIAEAIAEFEGESEYFRYLAVSYTILEKLEVNGFSVVEDD